MSDKPISDLRRRLLQDMTNRNFGAKTRHDYIRHIESFAKFVGRAPDSATGDDIRRFQAEQIAQGAQPSKMNTQASALRFFLGILHDARSLVRMRDVLRVFLKHGDHQRQSVAAGRQEDHRCSSPCRCGCSEVPEAHTGGMYTARSAIANARNALGLYYLFGLSL